MFSLFLRVLLFLNFIRVGVSGQENIQRQKGLIFVGNHPGLLEPMYFIAFLPVRVLLVADKGILRIPLLGRVLKTAGCLTYHPEGEDAGFMVDLHSALRDGESVLIFPPALRREGKEKGYMDMALLRTARACRAPIVPFVIKQTGADQIRRGIFVSPGKVRIIVGRPISPEEMDENGEAGLIELRFKELAGG